MLTPTASAGVGHTVTESGLAAGYALDGYRVIEDPLPPSETNSGLRHDLCFTDATTPLSGVGPTATIPDDGKNYVVCVQNARRTVYVVKRMADGGTGPSVSIALDGNSLGSLDVSTKNDTIIHVLSPLATPGVSHTITESGLAPGYVLDGYKVIEDPLPQSETSGGLRHDLCFGERHHTAHGPDIHRDDPRGWQELRRLHPERETDGVRGQADGGRRNWSERFDRTGR